MLQAVGATAAIGAAYALLPAFVQLEGATPDVPDGAGLEVASWGGDGAWFLHYRHGGSVTVTVPLRNSSALPLTVGAVTTPDLPRPLLTPTGATVPPTVPPLATREVTLTFRFDNCRYYHERAAQTVDRLTVRGHVLGREVTEEVALVEPLVVHGQVITDCPDRTLVRGDDRR